MKTAIRYYSKFGHSAQMAEEIGEVAGVKPWVPFIEVTPMPPTSKPSVSSQKRL